MGTAPHFRRRTAKALDKVKAVIQGHDIKKGNGAVLQALRGLALEHMEIVVRGGQRHAAAAPKHLVQQLYVLCADEEGADAGGEAEHLVE